MNRCPNCNKEIDDSAKFCGECGAAIPRQDNAAGGDTPSEVQQNESGSENTAQQTVPQGAVGETEELLNQPPIYKPGEYQPTEYYPSDYQAADAGAEQPEKPEKANPFKKLKGKIPKKALIFGAAGVIALAVVILVISLIAGSGSSAPEYSLYFKDGELYYSGLSGDPLKVSDELFETKIDSDELARAGSFFAAYCTVTVDGNMVFYPDGIDEDDSGVTIYYRYVNKPKKEPVKVDSDISLYKVSEKGDTVFYVKGDSDNLYKYDVKSAEKEKIAEDVYYSLGSGDLKTLYYMTYGDELYEYNGKESAKIDSDVEEFYTSEDYKTVIYIKNGSLYSKAAGADKVKISSDVDSIIRYFDSTGEIYYKKENTEGSALINYVTDDMKEKDSAMTEPQAPEYPSYFSFETQEEYDKAYDEYEKAYDEYLAAREEYWGKEYRDEMRAELEDEEIYSNTYSLYYYNGKEEKLICENCFDYEEQTAKDAAVISYKALDSENMEKAKLSEAESIYELKSAVEEAMSKSSQRYIAVKDSVSAVKQKENAKTVALSPDGKTAYFVDEVPEDSLAGNLYKVSVSGSEAGEPELYDSDVYLANYGILANGSLVYFKDYSSSKGDLYINGELADYEVFATGVRAHENSDAVVYFTEWEDGCGTLKIYKGGKAEEVGYDVSSYVAFEDGKIVYIGDYSDKSYTGALYLFKKNKPEKLDDDVSCLVPADNTVYVLNEGY